MTLGNNLIIYMFGHCLASQGIRGISLGQNLSLSSSRIDLGIKYLSFNKYLLNEWINE